MNADRGELFLILTCLYFVYFLQLLHFLNFLCRFHAQIHPNPCTGHALGRNSKLSARADHRFFQAAHIPCYVAANFREIQDWIADELSGP